MSLRFENAPLIELVAEIRWNPILSQVTQNAAVPQPQESFIQSTVVLPGGQLDQFFEQMTMLVAQKGYFQAERLVPQGFPCALYQPVMRYKSTQEGLTSVLLQAGVGMFSVNALRPYHGWAAFEPLLSDAIEAFLAARAAVGGSKPIEQIGLRYVNAFDPILTEGKDAYAVLSDVFGLSMKLPNSIAQRIEAGKNPNPRIQFVAPLAQEMQLGFTAGEGQFGGHAGMLLDLSITGRGSQEPTRDSLLDRLNQAHLVLHDIFVSMTKPVAHLMRPTEEA